MNVYYSPELNQIILCDPITITIICSKEIKDYISKSKTIWEYVGAYD